MTGPLLDLLRDAKKIVFATGAGISQESGIPTFRGRDGLWRNHDPMKLATIDAFHDNPGLVWEWYNERRANIFAAEPNDGHRAIAEFEDFAQVSVLTQNIDGLHQRAGSTDVLELHGSIARVRCVACGSGRETAEEFSTVPPTCKCGGMLRPDVVWFGEPVDHDTWQSAVGRASWCDVMIIVGTSLVVTPANILPVHAGRSGATLVEINPEPSAMSAGMDYSIRGTAADVLPRLAMQMRSWS